MNFRCANVNNVPIKLFHADIRRWKTQIDVEIFMVKTKECSEKLVYLWSQQETNSIRSYQLFVEKI
jgi:hypothetical protein